MLKGKTQVITIDGPAGAGKSTVAKALAKRLNYAYLDTGAMYRALTLKALRQKVKLDDESALVQLAAKTAIDLQTQDGKLKVFLDGEDVSEEIRSLEVTNNTFYIARAPKIREIMVNWQRIIGEKSNVVVEGRDTGTVVFPKAPHKFYLDANFEERVERRVKELRQAGKDVEAEKLKKELAERDNKDLTRTVGPLKKADDAIFIDSTSSTVEEVAEKILKYINVSRET
ncbi:MAG: cytidylate kinase [Omnitrophica WOR_2 bacterium GWA2_47_8]|nr:MAG: cytidylate kinase [Omnitrophica WOR_2 bacterium GWA2_47_8]